MTYKGEPIMEKNEKTYQKQTIECYLIIFIILFLFFGVFLIAGHVSGANWIGYISGLAKDLSFNIITFLV